ncbi:MAG: PEP/pyruvate-binding domain-containing protein [Candidatus Pacearchaeota archaeon]
MISKLEEVAKQERIFGNKARNLGVLINQGILVPNGIAVSYEPYSDYLDSRSFKNDFEGRLYQKMGSYSCQFAVRSSADVEDSGQRSYAGQFKTILDVSRDRLIEAIKKVYDSGINFNSSYSSNPIQMGIVIQEMIDAESSGVLFTYDLINQNNDSIMVELSQGKCENIVSGRTNPSLYIIDKNSKEVLLFEEGDQNVCLNPGQICQILSNAKKIESIFGKPQDIEFLFNSDKFYCLQSRDITTL